MTCGSKRALVQRFLVQSALSSVLLLGITVDAASAQHVGWLGPSYDGVDGDPTGNKAQSKLWWNDGFWWGCLWSESAQSFTIHRFRPARQIWVDTGTAVDPRPKSRADCLWDGTKLYVASHQYTAGVGAPGHALELYRYSYNPNADRYSLDVGFPTFVGDAKTEAMVFDKDSTGTLWAVWMSGLRVWIAHTVGDDLSWSAPVVHPRNTSDLTADDIASIVRFGDAIGVLWSDQVLQDFQFTFHENGAPPSSWSPVEPLLPGLADDHVNLRAAGDGRLFALLKTSTDQVRLLVRSTSGAWSDHLVAAAADGWTRPILVLDQEQQVVHAFGTRPEVMGTIYEKTAPMSALSFAPGPGTPVIADADGPALNDATSTKQMVRRGTGLVVLASHLGLRHYAYHHDSLGGPAPRPPLAVFSADPRTAFAPATVQFIDASLGQPTQWAWSFGDGAASTARHPVHAFALPGRYTVSLRVTNALGTHLLTRSELIDVAEPPTSLVLRPVADGHAREESPDNNYGGLPTLRVRADSEYHAFIKFFVPPGVGQVVSATLRLTCVVGSRDGGAVHLVDDDWSEPTLVWDNAPSIGGAPLGLFGEVDPGDVAEMDVSEAVAGSGTVSFGMESTSFHSIIYSSRQGDDPPELDLVLQPGAPAVAGFEENRTSGAGPLTVQFFDTSSGAVGAWHWDFGDGGTSDLQNPSHTFGPGTHAVSLTVASSRGADTLTKPGLVRVGGDGSASSALPASLPSVASSPLAGSFQGQLEGPLEDALERLEEHLSEAGAEILSREVRVEGVRTTAVVLGLLVGGQPARLRLRAGARELVTADWIPVDG